MGGQSPAMTRREVVSLLGASALAGCSEVSSLTSGDEQQQDGTQQGETVRAYVGSYHWGYFILDETGQERERLTLSSGEELRLTLFSVEADAAMDELPGAVRRGVPGSEERGRRNERTIPVPQGASLETLHEAAEARYPDHSLAIMRDEFLGARPGGGAGPGSPGQGPGGGGSYGPWGGHHGPYGPSGPQAPGGRYTPGGGHGPGRMPGGAYGPGGPGGGWMGGYGGLLAPPVYLWHHSTVPAELGFVVEESGSFGFACTVYCGYGHPYMVERGRVVVDEG